MKQNLSIKRILKIIGVFSIIGLFVFNTTFAQNQTVGQDGLELFNVSINTILSLLSRLRVFLATIAGKLMTNEWVYGSVFHLDIYLWKLRNIMKNFANFMLVALVLVEIGKIAIGKSKEGMSKIFTKTLLAAVLIQASRFVMGAVIDVSNITVSAVGSFPRVFMQNDKEVLSGLQTFANEFHQLSYEINFDNNEVTRIKNKEDITSFQQNDIIQSILPNTNSVSGPLIFMGASVFRFNEYTNISELEEVNRKKISLSISLKLLVIFFYTLALLFLVVANVIRIGFLWMFIVLSPIIVLYFSFLKKGSKGISKYFDASNILSAIFKPTIFVGYISLMLVVLVLIRSFFVKTPDADIGGASIVANADSSKMSIEGIGNVEIKGNILKDSLSQGQSMFSDLFVFLLGIFLMRFLVKLALTDKGPIGTTMDKIGINYDLMKGTMKNLPVLPGKFGIGAYRSVLTEQTQKTLGAAGINWNGRGGFSADFDKEGADILESKINQITGTKSYWKMNTHGEILRNIIKKKPENFWMESQNIAQNIQGGLTIDNYEWIGLFKDWLETSEGNRTGFSSKLKGNTSEDIKEFFKDEKNRKLFHENMQGSGVKGFSGTNTPSYDELKRISYGTGNPPTENNNKTE